MAQETPRGSREKGKEEEEEEGQGQEGKSSSSFWERVKKGKDMLVPPSGQQVIWMDTTVVSASQLQLRSDWTWS